MIGYIITAIIFSIPTVYYRIKLKEAERHLNKHIETRWQWEDWGE
jgi:hypothetical protein|tara:strand:+ start:1613 stop:1747 length:135 start_codon:yes stop_codon:yes gene_type:complete